MAGSKPPTLDRDVEHKLAAGLFNEVWRLMEMPQRTDEQTDAMLHAAHASRHHWAAVGIPVKLARGEWLCARVYSVLGRAEPAVWHARRCLELLEAAPDREDWDLAAAYEALARAYAVAGDRTETRRWAELGRASAAGIADPQDRALVEDDLRSLDEPAAG
jgi:hypothetical protein